jgi:membrane-associated phospholipid phosphatase
VRLLASIAIVLLFVARTSSAQGTDTTSRGDKTFLTRRDLAFSGIALGATALLSTWDDDIARASQDSRYQSSSTHDFALAVSKVNETTLTIAGVVTWGIARLSKSKTVADVALHSTEAVVLGSLASQVIRGPLGRSRPYYAGDSAQYDFHFGQGFSNFKYRAFPSIHTSSSMAVATVLTMETHRRHPRATPFVAPVLFAAGLLPGLARIQLDQHWATDIFAGAFMGVLAGYKVTKYSHDHPNNRFDRALLSATVTQAPNGQIMLGFSPF